MRRFYFALALAMVALCAHRACGYNRMGNDRILLMNDDTRTYRAVTGQAYTNTNILDGADGCFWTHGTTNYNYGSTASARSLLDGTNHVFWQVVNGVTNALWSLNMASAGTLFTTDAGRCFVPYSTTAVETKCEWSVYGYNARLRRWITMHYSATNANCEVILLNDADASVTSPFYSEGIGTIYFDAVNSSVSGVEHSLQLCVATNAVGEAEFTAETPLEECDWQIVPVEAFAVSNKTQISKLELADATLVPMNSTVEKGNLFFRIRKRLQYFGPIRFRIQRATFNSSGALSTIIDLIDIDNIIASYPVKTVEFSECGIYDEGGEGDLSLRGRVKLEYLGDFTIPSSYGVTKDFALNKVTMRYCSYNRGNAASEWQTVDMVNVDSEGVLWESIWPLDLSDGRECIEYGFDADIYSPYYLFGDYTGCSLVGYPDDWSERVTSVSCSATSHVCTVTFNANGGSMDNPGQSMTCVSGSKYGPMPVPVMPKYRFLGWFTSPQGGTRVSEGEAVSISSDTELFAHWQWDYWNTSVNSDGTLTVTGSSSPLVGDVEIPSEIDGVPVTCIGEHAFEGSVELASMAIPDSVTSIGDAAFSGCSGLASVEIPVGVTNIADYVFAGCVGLASVAIHDGVTGIGNHAFEGCIGLADVALPDRVTSIGESAFRGCSGLIGVEIPVGVTNIADYAFAGCVGLAGVAMHDGVAGVGNHAFEGCIGFADVALPDSVTSIGESAFRGCSGLIGVEIPVGVTNIADYVFAGCVGLASVAIHDGVTGIGNHAFEGCIGLADVALPDRVTSIGESAFSGCSGMRSVALPNSLTSIGLLAFYGCGGLASVTIPQFVCTNSLSNLFPSAYSTIAKVVISEGVTDIGLAVFHGCSGLTDVAMPDSLTSIGEDSFYGCSNLTSVTIPQLVCTNRLSDVFPSAYSTIAKVVISDGVTNVGSEAFDGCSGLTSVTIPQFVCTNRLSRVFPCFYRTIAEVVIPEGVTSIDPFAFVGCSGLISISVLEGNGTYSSANGLLLSKDGKMLIRGVNGDVVIPAGVTSVEANAFDDCSGLASVTIPDGVTSIGSSAFSGCTNLTSVTIPDTVTSIGSSAFRHCSNLICISVAEDNQSFSSANGLLLSKSGKTLVQGVNGDVTIPDGVTSIGGMAFSGCTGLTKVTIPNSVTSIGISAFSGCTGLTSVMIPGSVKSIGGSAFGFCSGLKDLIISDGVRSVGHTAFQSCRLTSVTIPDSVTSIGTRVFWGCAITNATIPQSVCANSLTNVFYSTYRCLVDVTISAGATNIGDYAFFNCSRLKSVAIPDSVTRIGDNAFSGCSVLTGVTIPDSVTSIENDAFMGCSKLESVVFMGNAPTVGSSVFSNVVSGCTAYVSPKSTGWNVEPGEKWNGLTLQYWPEVLNDVASDAEVAEIMGTFADEWIVHEITSVAQYDAFKSWVAAKNLYQPAVAANAHVAAAYLLGAERLFEYEPIVEIEAMSVGDAENGAMGPSLNAAMTVAVAVKDGERTVAVDAEKVAAMLEATSDLDDWTGEAKLVPTVVAADADASGKMTFTVMLGDGTAPQAFLRIKR